MLLFFWVARILLFIFCFYHLLTHFNQGVRVDCNLAILTGYLRRTLWFAYCHALHAASSQRVMDCKFHPRQCVCALFRHGVGGLAGK
ncbi:hypothetical protein LOK49_LG09G01338 [Camellia lanceoleosa]|uniref:Uncharacterized protein n=1 Tax=Camellia lanceoleosa TaxID=1840588 RepID=A0ACC0GM54_9ERIC|nr:hypothetical protein LOK49_LG09G01338 [Camellia lanceoleosa]